MKWSPLSLEERLKSMHKWGGKFSKGLMAAAFSLTLALPWTVFAQTQPGLEEAQPNGHQIVPGDFASLKSMIEAPDRPVEVIVPGGVYHATQKITVDRDLQLKNAPGEAVTVVYAVSGKDPKDKGETLFDLISGQVLLDPDEDEHWVVDGQVDHQPAQPFEGTEEDFNQRVAEANVAVSDKGQFVTVHEGAQLTINHGIFKRAANAGAQTAPLFVDGGTLILNGGQIRDNLAVESPNYANELTHFKDKVMGKARSAGVAVRSGYFEMNGGEIAHNLSTFASGAALTVFGKPDASGFKLGRARLTGGKIHHNVCQGWDSDNYDGAGAYVGMKGELIIEETEMIENRAHGAGGALCAGKGSHVEILGGVFKQNRAVAGGAVASFDEFVLFGGTLLDPLVKQGIHGIPNPEGKNSYEIWKNKGYTVDLSINGGHFEGNEAFCGGAVYIASQEAKIEAGEFLNNRATRFGGGLYVSTNPYVLYLKNVFIDDNEAAETITAETYLRHPFAQPSLLGLPLDDATYPSTKGSGGAIWFCPVGHGAFYASNGLADLDNQASQEGATLTATEKQPGLENRFVVTLPQRSLGGLPLYWYDDPIGHRVKLQGEDLVPREPIKAYAGPLYLASQSVEGARSVAEAQARVIFRGNRARRGGAIGSNGGVIIGDPDEEIQLKLSKKWQGEPATQSVELTLMAQLETDEGKAIGEPYTVENIRLSKDKGWTHEVKDLPRQASNQFIRYWVVEQPIEGYAVAYDPQEIRTAKIPAQQTVEWVLTNQPASPPTPTSPTNPPTQPTQPTQPNVPSKPSESKPIRPDRPTQPAPTKPKQPIPSLPQTGEKRGATHSMAGVLVVAVICITYLHRKKRVDKRQKM